jgi:hypothetical protein
MLLAEAGGGMPTGRCGASVTPTILAPEVHRMPKKRVGILTSGGDAPGMNAAIRAVFPG